MGERTCFFFHDTGTGGESGECVFINGEEVEGGDGVGGGDEGMGGLGLAGGVSLYYRFFVTAFPTLWSLFLTCRCVRM